MTRITLALCLLISNCATAGLPHEAAAFKPTADKSLLELLLGTPAAVEGCPENAQLLLTEIDEASAAKFVSQVAACKGRAITVEINSPGGSVIAAFDIQKAIERHDKPVYCVVDGMAASAAFVTLQSCAHRYMTDRSLLMAHEASIGSKGQEVEHNNAAAALRAVNWGMAEHCSKRMGITHAEFASRVSNGQEWYLSQLDALRENAIDGRAESVSEIAAMASEG